LITQSLIPITRNPTLLLFHRALRPLEVVHFSKPPPGRTAPRIVMPRADRHIAFCQLYLRRASKKDSFRDVARPRELRPQRVPSIHDRRQGAIYCDSINQGSADRLAVLRLGAVNSLIEGDISRNDVKFVQVGTTYH
jgi:hypothetical protein